MSREIKSINKIVSFKEFDSKKCEDVEKIYFYGDGVGDFEESGDTTALSSLKDYENYLREQLLLVEKCMNKITNGE